MTRAFFNSLLTALSCLASSGVQAQFPVFPSADLVLGQTDLDADVVYPATQSSLGDPSGLAVDPVSGKVFVSSVTRHRILRFASSTALANGANAEAVIGQSDYTTVVIGASATTLQGPYGLDVDHLGRLWVADSTNNRVLMYEDAANLPEFNASADLVLGQPDFVTRTAGTTQAKMDEASGVHVDAADNLWVADYRNDRVLKFANVSSLTNGAPATTVLGQADFITGTNGTSDVKMYGPVAMFVDRTNRLWVADQNNNRVLRFDGASSLTNGAAANAVLGQADFTTGTSGSTPVKIEVPSALAFDRNGTLYITDTFNDRVIYHKNPGSKANGATPDGVIGQPDLSTFIPGTSAQKMIAPYGGLDFDAAGNLWVTDSRNERALRFPGEFIATSPVLTGKAPKSVTKGTLALKGTATDPNGIAEIRFRVGKGPFKTAVGTTAWKLSAKLKPGKNTIEILAVDTFGNVSPARFVKVKRG